MSRQWVVPLPYDRPPLTGNDRAVWQARHRVTAEVLGDVRWLVRAQRIPPLRRCSVELHWAPGDSRRRDADNLVATQKVCCDAVVAEGVVADDVPALMAKPTPVIHPPGGHDARAPYRLWLVVAELDGEVGA